ncbi:Protein EXECUTER 1, chloroplastic, partial [Mucuna pruriens]
MTLTHPSMASTSSSIPSSCPTTSKFIFPNSKLCSSFPFSFSLPLPSISHTVSNSLNKFNSLRGSASAEDAEWDWDRWRLHFHEVDEQERLLGILKSHLGDAVLLEDYEDAAKLKVAIAAVATNDTVGTVIFHFNRAIEEERYSDATFLRDEAGIGLVGWWSGMSKDPHGLIIRITPEHGRYVARSYSPGQLATSAVGVPLFEIFLTKKKNGEFKSQVVYLNQRGAFYSPPTTSSEALDAAERSRSVESPEDRSELFVGNPEDPEVADDRNDSSDPSEGMPGFQNVLKDTIPGVKMKVLKVTTPNKVDKDIISKVIEQITDEEGDEDEDEDADKDNETKSPEQKDINSETDDEIELNSCLETSKHEEQNEQNKIAAELSSSLTTKYLLRIPAKLETTGRGSFSFTIEKVVNQLVGHGKGKASPDKSTKTQGQHSIEHVMFNLAKFIRRGKVPSKVLKDVGELMSLSLSQARYYEQLSGTTNFSRIEIPTSLDPLNGLYIGVHGLYSSEVVQLRCRYGHWQEDGGPKEPSNLEFYEYVEALKLTGDPFIPAGQVAFRAKIGKRYQLPHKGIIPEEFGLSEKKIIIGLLNILMLLSSQIARYKGQGRLGEPRFRRPRWVDGELVILDGKRYMNAGPVLGFVFWALKHPFLILWMQSTCPQNSLSTFPRIAILPCGSDPSH